MIVFRFCLTALTAIGAFAATPAAAQVESEEIVVLGDLESAEDLPTQTKPDTNLAQTSRTAASESARFIRCTELPEPDELRTILDTPVNRIAGQRALHRFIRTHSGCYGGLDTVVRPSPWLGVCNPQGAPGAPPKNADQIFVESNLPAEMRSMLSVTGHRSVRMNGDLCRVTFDRGALFELAVEKYGDDITLSRGLTFHPVIRERFETREIPRSESRSPTDREFFYRVACMVQIRPEYGQMMLQTEPGSETETRLRQLLIGYGAPCVGYAEEVVADGSQFRAYVAESVYSWMVAVRGTDSLVP
ncbi:hypothetical protein [Stakelama tenebrarum]|uniref:Uncharacterized protein n=1 Tax=Stakelama tenebrarum TaxID=2711215 RepID=A0A6G6Y323_9SPHN|nr:hypothetical protein [Sphingosinithalassobacter tenebrarum]QIG79207.1 hypothetical protein G5C33_04980 [Sphingosinithalassobacter tenebrarum]